MTVGLRDYALTCGDDWSLDDGFGRLTWAEENERINRLIHGVRGLGLESGDCVAILGGNRREWIEAALASAGDAKVWVPINWHFSADEVAYVLENAAVKLLIADAEYGQNAHDAAEMAGVDLRVAYNGAIAGFADYDDILASSPDTEPEGQTAGRSMLYTSGTTGHPKGVVRKNDPLGTEIAAAREGTLRMLNVLQVPTVGGVAYVGAPLYHGGPLSYGLVPHYLGSALITRRKWDAEEMLQTIEEDSVTTAYAVPTHFARLLKLPDETRASYDVSSLRSVHHTAAPCPRDIKQQMIEWWGPVIYEVYGASEGGLATMVTSEEWLTKPGTVGSNLPGASIHIFDDEGNEVGPNAVGQIYVRNAAVEDYSFHDDEEKTASVHKEPGLFTFGDIGYVDDDGYLFLSDRQIDMIISGGVNIYPAEIEAVLITDPLVADVSVFGIPNEEFGEEVKAAVELANGTEEAAAEIALRNLCREKLAGYMVPRSFDFGPLPRTPTGKLPKRLLRAKYWEGTGRSI